VQLIGVQLQEHIWSFFYLFAREALQPVLAECLWQFFILVFWWITASVIKPSLVLVESPILFEHPLRAKQ